MFDGGERLAELRQAKGWTQKKLAKLLNITDRAVAYYEAGQRTPPVDMLMRLADLFGVTVDYLLGRDAGECIALEEILKLDTVMLGGEVLDSQTKDGILNFASLVQDVSKEREKGKKDGTSK